MAFISRVIRRAHFSAAHRYFNEQLSEEENRRLYGSYYTPHGLGHNYILEAYIEGPINPESGMILGVREIDGLLKEITSQLDHRHLNFDVPYFKNRIPTTENLALYCYEFLAPMLTSTDPLLKLQKVRVYESEDLWVDYGANIEPEV